VVVGDDWDVGVFGLFQYFSEGSVVDGGYDEDLVFFGDYVVDLGDLGWDVVVGVDEVDFVVGCFELGDCVDFIGNGGFIDEHCSDGIEFEADVVFGVGGVEVGCEDHVGDF